MSLMRSRPIVAAIKERQAKELRELREQHDIQPRLAIVVTTDDPVIATYVRKKQQYGSDLGIAVDVHRVSQDAVPELLTKLNADQSVGGVIVQLPLERPQETNEIVQLVAPEKDVDALGSQQWFEPATPMAILWLLEGYNVTLYDKKVVLVGRGKLVGAPLERILQREGIDVEVVIKETENPKEIISKGDVIITATGCPGVVVADMVKHGAAVVDAGVASEGGKTVGDVTPDVYEREDLLVSPLRGGVGPLTVCALFENVIRATKRMIEA